MNYRQNRNLDRLHLAAARLYAGLSLSLKRKVGCVIARGTEVLAVGWNQMPEHFDSNCELQSGSELLTRPEVLHAEQAALMQIARSQHSSAGATVYVTTAPCLQCAKLLAAAGIVRVCYADVYKNNEGLDLLNMLQITTEHIHED